MCENNRQLTNILEFMHMINIPKNLKYTAQHLWVKVEDDGFYLTGITDYAQDLLGDIVFVDVPVIGARLTAGSSCGLVESVKTGSDLHAPLNGTVLAVNETLQSHPEQINDNPYDTWIFKFQADAAIDLSALLDAEAYRYQLVQS